MFPVCQPTVAFGGCSARGFHCALGVVTAGAQRLLEALRAGDWHGVVTERVWCLECFGLGPEPPTTLFRTNKPKGELRIRGGFGTGRGFAVKTLSSGWRIAVGSPLGGGSSSGAHSVARLIAAISVSSAVLSLCPRANCWISRNASRSWLPSRSRSSAHSVGATWLPMANLSVRGALLTLSPSVPK